MSIGLLVLGLVLFVCLVVVHEFGHFLAARKSGVTVEEFGIGFPPRAWSKKMRSGYLFSLNWLPLGGFVRLKGEHDADVGKGSFGSANLWQKTKIMLAGVVMNLLAAFVIFAILAIVGMPQLINNQFTIKSNTKTLKSEVLVGYVEPNSPASKINLQSRDRLIGVGLTRSSIKPTTTASALPNLTKEFAGRTVLVKYSDNGQIIYKSVKLRTSKVVVASQKTSNPVGYLGISPIEFTLQKSTWSSPIEALGLMKQITVLTFKGIWTAITSLVKGNVTQASSQVAGPVAIVEILKDGSSLGYQFILMIVAVISLSLAIVNVLPIPALDGGRLFLMLIPRLISGRPLKQSTEEKINAGGFIALMILFVLITIAEV